MQSKQTGKNAEKVKELMEKLDEGIKSVIESGEIEDYLKFLASFHRFSSRNSWLIFLTNPDATLVKGYAQWKKIGRHVKKGEKGIRILAPSQKTYTKTVEKVDENGKKYEEEEKYQYTKFIPVSVFDISQTEGDPLPHGPKELRGNSETADSLYTTLKEVIPVEVQEKYTGEAFGYFNLVTENIAVSERAQRDHQTKTLIHEYAHYLLHRKGAEFEKETHQIREAQAESIAYVVCQYFGLDTSQYSLNYIAGWTQSDIEIVKKISDEVQHFSSQIINQIEKEEEISKRNINEGMIS